MFTQRGAIFIIAAIIAGAATLGGFLWWRTMHPPEPGKYDTFAKCLAEKGAKEYGAYWCLHCKDQKEMFGGSFEHVPYVECAARGVSGQTKECEDAGITGYPTWVFADGSRQSGAMTFKELSEKTGCALPL